MIKIYNSIFKDKKVFSPYIFHRIRIYVCGVTVYNFCHIGHAKMMISFDIIQRWLIESGYIIEYVRNITNIDDKIIEKSLKSSRNIYEITIFYIKSMNLDEYFLGNLKLNHEPLVTSHIKDVINLIKKIKNVDLACRNLNDDITYLTKKFKKYGKFSGKKMFKENFSNNINKESNFVLWKFSKKNESFHTKWTSFYGLGRPGWHIECSAINESLLCLPLDIHGGGLDLKCNHHENEIAQSEPIFNKNLSKIWIHCGTLIINKDKMSKSINNHRTIRELICSKIINVNFDYKANKNESEILRFFFIKSSYKSNLNYNLRSLINIKSLLDYLYKALTKYHFNKNLKKIDWFHYKVNIFFNAMNEDFNSSIAMKILFKFAYNINCNFCAKISYYYLKYLGNIFGILQQSPYLYFIFYNRYSDSYLRKFFLNIENIKYIAIKRKKLKKKNFFSISDELRYDLKINNVYLEDINIFATYWRII